MLVLIFEDYRLYEHLRVSRKLVAGLREGFESVFIEDFPRKH
jgi:hypothetical protein